MDEKEMAWWDNGTPGSMYGLPPPFIPGAEGWGAPPMPPPNSGAEGWTGGPVFGGPPPVMPNHQLQQQQMQMGQGGYPVPGGPCWNPGNMFEVPPPQHHLGGGMQQMRGGQPRGGRGFMRGGGCPNPMAPTFNHFEQTPMSRGGRPGRGGRGGMTGGRGGYVPAGNGGDHVKEKTDGRQSAIAETIAMMKKMQMEDKERKEAAKEKEEKRKAMNPDSAEGVENPDEDEAPVDGPAPPRRHGYQARENAQPRGRGAKRGGGAKTRGGGKNGQKVEGPQSFVAGGPLPVGPGNQFAVPPGAPGGEGFSSYQGMDYHLMGMPPGAPVNDFNGFPNNNGYPYAQQVPDQFNPGFKNFGMGPPANQMPPDFQGNGQFMPQQRMPRQNDQGFGRGGGQRGRGGGSNRRQRGYEPDDEPVVRWDQGVDVFDNGHGAIANGQTQQPAKNLNSEQGTPKGQLALLASNVSLSNNNNNRKKKPVDTKNLRERLIQQLVSGQSECMICIEKVKPLQATWDCKQCYQIFHIFCIKKWSRSQMALADTESGGWRCPGCQSVTKSSPNYVCFCGKMTEPAYNRNETPHSCGEVCAREKKIIYPDCSHRCNILCHPGPCPSCTASVTRTCPCGKTKKSVKCGNPVSCTETCDKPLSCGEHRCKSLCHEGSCDECDVIHQQTCFCPRNQPREIQCGKVAQEEVKIGGFSCQEECQKIIECGNHKCSQPCHLGDCGRCDRDVALVSRCPCEKKSLSEMGIRRKTCLDDIPSCGSICGKKLTCGQVGKNHLCQAKCHTGPCPPCSLTTKVLCRCGAMDKDLECVSLTSRADDALCEKKCSKKRNCGKHKCGAKCCIDPNHICTLICGKPLSCGLHRCAECCHFGNCAVCTNVSFEELRCYCGSKVIYPPIACGTKPPPCSEPCRRAHSCNHDVRHTCHSEAQCPPCAALTEKWCHGKHELRKNVPCHLESIFCGRPCGLALPCGRHQCIKPCHQGSCLNEAKQEKCSQPCVQVRPSCGHPCNAPCHEGSCPNTPCNEKVKLNCACGNLSATVMCSKNESEYRRLHTALLASKMSNIQYGSGSTTIELNDLWPSTSVTKSGSSRKQVLECNEECAKLERNRRLSLALQIENPELSSKLTAPKFSEFLKEFSRKEPAFSQNIHDKLTELVELAKESKQKSRSHSFPCMNREKRQFVHEYSDHFGLTTESFDCEPNRNVVATAFKDKSWLPSQSINEVVQNLRKALGPVSLTSKNNGSVSGSLTALQPIPKTSKGVAPSASEEPAKKPPAPFVDYFDD